MRLWQILFGTILVLALLIVGGLVLLPGSYTKDDETTAAVKTCPVGDTVTLTLQNNRIEPASVDIEPCQRITIVNDDVRAYRLAIGTPDKHLPYPGFKESTLSPGQSYSFIATKAGSYQLHDHLDHNITTQLIIR